MNTKTRIQLNDLDNKINLYQKKVARLSSQKERIEKIVQKYPDAIFNTLATMSSKEVEIDNVSIKDTYYTLEVSFYNKKDKVFLDPIHIKIADIPHGNNNTEMNIKDYISIIPECKNKKKMIKKIEKSILNKLQSKFVNGKITISKKSFNRDKFLGYLLLV